MDFQLFTPYFTSSFNHRYIESIAKICGVSPDFSIVHDAVESPTNPNQIDILNSRIGFFDLTRLELDLLPLEREDYDYFGVYLAASLQMFDRQDPHQVLSSSDRISLYWRLVQFWKSLVIQRDPKMLISRNIPHFASEYILYLTFRRYQKPFFMMDYLEYIEQMQLITAIEDRTIGRFNPAFKLNPESIAKASEIIRQITDKNYAGVTSTYKKVNRLDEESFFYRLKVRLRLLAYTCYKPFKRSRSTLLLNKPIYLRPFQYQIGLEFFKNTYKIQQLHRYYKKVSGFSDEKVRNKKIMFFPLHYQPERTSLPDAIPFHDQLRVVDVLSRALPEDWFLLIKEHPTTFRFPYKVFLRGNYSRSKQFYDQLKSYSNVELVPLEDSTQDWIRKSRGIATLTGSVTLEALCSRKKVILFGHTWYRSFPNTHVFTNAQLLTSFLEESSEDFQENSIAEMEKVLAQYTEKSVRNLGFNKASEKDVSSECETYTDQVFKYLSQSKSS